MSTIEFPKKSGFKIRPKRIRNKGKDYGKTFQIDIPPKYNGGVRSQKCFKSLPKAKEYCQSIFDQSSRFGSELLGLSDSERAEAVLAFQKCKSAGVSLLQALDEGIPILLSKAQDISFSDVINSRIAFKRKRLEMDDIRKDTFKDFEKRAKRIENALGHYHIAEVNRKVIMDYFNADETSLLNRKNQLGIISQCTKYAVEEGYIPSNPCDTLTESDRISIRGSRRVWKEPSIMDYNLIEPFINKALECPKLNVFNSIVVQLFCGVRPEEVAKLVWEDIDFSSKNINISNRIAKGRFIREIPIPDNAMKWLSLSDKTKPFSNPKERQHEGKMRSFRIAFGEIEKWKENGRNRTKSTWWENDILRHTFASYHYARWRNKEGSTKTENAMGHITGDSMLFTHYRRAVKEDKGKQYFNIEPKPSGAKVIPITSVA
tara:strand:- start:2219 stop:3511 length:1293 start_codon:yes stop_codon:yes gene_type:complete